jgi:hypothetical protein
MSTDTIDETAIYWWASSSGAIMSQNFGATTPPTLVKDQCTSCHSMSRNGQRLGYSRCVGGDCGQLFAGFMKLRQRDRGPGPSRSTPTTARSAARTRPSRRSATRSPTTAAPWRW